MLAAHIDWLARLAEGRTVGILYNGDGDGAFGVAQTLVRHLHRQVQHARVHLEHDVHPARDRRY